MTTTTEKLNVFRSLIDCSQSILFSEYDARTFDPLSSQSASPDILYFLLSVEQGAMPWWTDSGPDFHSLRTEQGYRPVVCSNSLGMTWIAEIEELGGTPNRIHALGPVFNSDYSVPAIKNLLDCMNLKMEQRDSIMEFIQEIPVVSTIRFYEYGLMLHWCLTDEKITISDLMYLHSDQPTPEQPRQLPGDHHGSYLAEQRMLQFVRDGNMKYRQEIDRLASAGGTSQIIKGHDLRFLKNYVIIYTALCCRAAVEGGLDVEVAYSLSDHYLKSIEEADSISTLHELSNAMVRDYIERVHRVKTGTSLSAPIRNACEWISLSPKEQTISSLAKKLGYTDYYFSRRFKDETGKTVKEYILEQKIEYARKLLLTSNLPISDVAHEAGFDSQSYFTARFRAALGMTPTEYRKNSAGDPSASGH